MFDFIAKSVRFALAASLLAGLTFTVAPAQRVLAESIWVLHWSDEFNGSGGVSNADWIYDTGTSYPGGPANWGTGEIEVMSSSTANVFQSGGFLNIRALHTGSDPLTGWTSGRIETKRKDFQPPTGQKMAIEASIQLPNVTGSAAQGYWPAFWMLGAPYRGNYWNWPSVGEIDIMENINGTNTWVGTFHCGVNPGGPCNETTGISASDSGFSPPLQAGFHTYRFEWDKSISPNQFRWYVDGVQRHTVNANQVDATTWNNAANHGFFVILNVAMGGGWPGNPTASTASGGTMLVDYVRIYYSSLAPPVLNFPVGGDTPPTTRPLFDWASVATATSYTLQISTNQNFTSFVLNVPLTPSAYVPTADLPRNTLLFWRVRANGPGGPSAWSRVRHFFSANPPGVPALLAPPNGANVSNQPLLDWNDVTPAATYYEVQISTDQNFTTVLGRGQGGKVNLSQYTPEAALGSGTFYWQVRAVSGGADGGMQFSQWSAVRRFNVTP
ncbi:MAG: family 16 glycosylhydrolase [Chloroflexi bacterium]|nr:family 16 glycosylhydrolase [Chloroflexota bacterium]